MSQATHLAIKYHSNTKVDTRIVEEPIEFEDIAGVRYIKQDKHVKLHKIAINSVISIFFVDLSY